MKVINLSLGIIFFILFFTCIILVIGICKVGKNNPFIRTFIFVCSSPFLLCFYPGYSSPLSQSLLSQCCSFFSSLIKRLVWTNYIRAQQTSSITILFRPPFLQLQLLLCLLMLLFLLFRLDSSSLISSMIQSCRCTASFA